MTKISTVAVGNDGSTTATEAVLGSVPSTVAHQAPFSALVVKTT